MKVKVELDISPKEFLEIFEGNVEAIQKGIISLFMKQMSVNSSDDNFSYKLWQEYLNKSKEYFENSQGQDNSQ